MDSSINSGVSNPVLAWLQTEGVKCRETTAFVGGLAEELLRAGIDVWRVTTGIHILHPQIDGSRCLWESGKPVAEWRFKLDLRVLANSPMGITYAGRSYRAPLGTAPEPGEFPILADLRKDGVTDYVALPVPFSDGSWKAVTYATRRPGGFPEEHIALFESLVPTLALVLEVQTLHRTTLTLLETYVGQTAGRRVLDGAIKRGMCEAIQAVIWFCDLRGFTELSEKLPGEELVAFLNDYFGARRHPSSRRSSR
jgi:adenylate cyclase